MTDSRKKYVQKLFYLAPAQTVFLLRLAVERNPDAGKRAQSGVLRDVIDFASAHEPLFLSWLATRGTITPGGNQ